jgi:hypothetical protein
VHAKRWCEEGWYTSESPKVRWVVNEGIYSSDPQGTRGCLQSLMKNCSSGETSVGMYKLKEAIEKFCSDLLASHQRKCECALAGMVTWRFSSCRKVMESLLVGTRCKPLQSINYHDRHALGYERFGVLTGLVGFEMVWISYVWMGNHSGQL